MENEKFWTVVKHLMEIKNTSLETLAITCQIPLSILKGCMRMNFFPTVIEGYRIARVLGVSVEYLITGENLHAKRLVSSARPLMRHAEKERVRVYR